MVDDKICAQQWSKFEIGKLCKLIIISCRVTGELPTSDKYICFGIKGYIDNVIWYEIKHRIDWYMARYFLLMNKIKWKIEIRNIKKGKRQNYNDISVKVNSETRELIISESRVEYCYRICINIFSSGILDIFNLPGLFVKFKNNLWLRYDQAIQNDFILKNQQLSVLLIISRSYFCTYITIFIPLIRIFIKSNKIFNYLNIQYICIICSII